jgi:glycosyltransferase involved in cell wall biosynthesis
MKLIVAQIGARRGYAVPDILEKAGMLERFYTDLVGNVGVGRILSAFPLPNGRFRALARRRVPESIRAKTAIFVAPVDAILLPRAKKKGDAANIFRQTLRWSNALGRLMCARGFGEATHLYSMLGEGGPLLGAARSHGLRVVVEIYILLSTEKILAQERKQFPSWEPEAPDFSAIRREVGGSDLPITAQDFAICPSDAVRDDLVTNFGVQSAQCAVVPYGMNPELLSIRNEPVRGRVLFAGTADLRKGIHYFAKAAEKLAHRQQPAGHRLEFRVAGNVQPRVAQQPACRYLNFLGRIPRADMAREFAAADIFVLPSLAEGSAEVTYEALACGVPVITTPEAGSVVRDGIDGRIIPSRDPEVLAEAIGEIIEDREKRERMAHAARERARDYTWERYGERLVTALKSLG